jgi:hypothetical protein
MQVAAVVKWVCGKQCGAAVDALKGGTGALVHEVDIHKLRAGTITYMGAHAAKFPLSIDHAVPSLAFCGQTASYS